MFVNILSVSNYNLCCSLKIFLEKIYNQYCALDIKILITILTIHTPQPSFSTKQQSWLATNKNKTTFYQCHCSPLLWLNCEYNSPFTLNAFCLWGIVYTHLLNRFCELIARNVCVYSYIYEVAVKWTSLFLEMQASSMTYRPIIRGIVSHASVINLNGFCNLILNTKKFFQKGQRVVKKICMYVL